MLVSNRIDSGDPVLEAFTDQTYVWLEEMKIDFERCMGTAFEGGSGVLFASDVLVAIHDHDASWTRFDVGEFERWVTQLAPGFQRVLPEMLADVMCFTNYLARHGHIEPAIAIATQERAMQVIGEPPAPGNRHARRRARRMQRRSS